jgi:CheY-like chemotaxis protein
MPTGNATHARMDILILIAAVWGGFFLLSIAFAAATSRSRNAASETTVIDFRVHPLLLPGDVEQLKPLRDIVTSKMNSSNDRGGKRPSGRDREVIFVVDDDPDIVNLIKHVLDLEGFEVRSFTDPEEAFKAFQSAARRPEMIVTDYCMEPMNGLELIDRCRAEKPDLKTIVISGMVDEHDFRKLPSKTDHFIAKPFKVSNLIETLNETLARN